MGFVLDIGFVLYVITFIIILVDLRGENGLINIEKDIWKYVVAYVLAFFYPFTLPLYIVRYILITVKKGEK